jgi:hypothetical protein
MFPSEYPAGASPSKCVSLPYFPGKTTGGFRLNISGRGKGSWIFSKLDGGSPARTQARGDIQPGIYLPFTTVRHLEYF